MVSSFGWWNVLRKLQLVADGVMVVLIWMVAEHACKNRKMYGYISGVFRTKSNIYDGACSQKWLTVLAVNYGSNRTLYIEYAQS